MELIGREILIEDIEINYFKGQVEVIAFNLKEKDSEEDFVKFDNFMIDLEYMPLFSGTIHIKASSLDHPVIHIIQNQKTFNFSDLLELGSDSTTVDTTAEESSWHFVLEEFNMTRGSMAYESDLIKESVGFDSLKLWVPFISDTSDDIFTRFSGDYRNGGSFIAYSDFNLSESSYKNKIDIKDINLKAFKPYIDPFLELNLFEGLLSSEFAVSGSWEDTDIINFGGRIGLEEFQMTDVRDEKVLGIKSFELDIDTIEMKNGTYRLNAINVEEFFALYEMYDEGSNWENMFLMDSSDVATSLEHPEDVELNYSNPFQLFANYLFVISHSYKSSTYRMKGIHVNNSTVHFNDFTPSAPFRYELTELEAKTGDINSTAEKFRIDAKSVLNKTGKFEGFVDVYTDNLENIDLYYTIEGTDLTVFSPYSADYVDFPIATGELLYECETTIRDGQIVSSNVIKCEDFDFGNSYDGNPLYNLPVKLAVVLMRDLDGDINLDIPIEGDLNDPEYKLWKVIWQTIKNIIVKAVTAPFRLLAGLFEGVDEDDIKQVRFGFLQKELNKKNEKSLNQLGKILSKKEELNVEFKRVTKKYEEAESFAIAECKYRYLNKVDSFDVNQLTDEELRALGEFNVKDSLFIKYVDQFVPEQDRELPIQRKCMDVMSTYRDVSVVDHIGERRSSAIRNYLVQEKEIDASRIRFILLPPDSLVSSRTEAIYRVGFWLDDGERTLNE